VSCKTNLNATDFLLAHNLASSSKTLKTSIDSIILLVPFIKFITSQIGFLESMIKAISLGIEGNVGNAEYTDLYSCIISNIFTKSASKI